MIAGFEIGCRAPLRIRHERVECARGVLPAQSPWRLFYVSDLHLTGRRQALVDGLVEAVQHERPDVVLLGGDLIDRRSGLATLTDCVRRLGAAAPVLAVPGNHDAWFGLDAVIAAVRAGGGRWLAGAGATLTRDDRAPLHLHASPASTSIPALRVLVAHHPDVADAAAAANACCGSTVSGSIPARGSAAGTACVSRSVARRCWSAAVLPTRCPCASVVRAKRSCATCDEGVVSAARRRAAADPPALRSARSVLV